MSNLFVPGEDGKPVFLGKEDPNNIIPHKPSEGSKMECPVCHEMFPYLVGVDTRDGGRMGCEACWKPSGAPVQDNDTYDKSKEMM